MAHKIFGQNVVIMVGEIEDIATASEMDALLTEKNEGKAYRFVGTSDNKYKNGNLYLVTEAPPPSMYRVTVKASYVGSNQYHSDHWLYVNGETVATDDLEPLVIMTSEPIVFSLYTAATLSDVPPTPSFSEAIYSIYAGGTYIGVIDNNHSYLTYTPTSDIDIRIDVEETTAG